MSDSQVMPSEPSDIPNFLMLDQVPTNYVQQLETDLLEPVVFQQGTETSDGFARFTLQNKGFLHSHSKIFLSVEPEDNVSEGYFQPHVGVAQVIKKAVLKIGNKTLNELDSWDSLHGVKSSLISNENNVQREMYTTGRFLNHGFKYNEESRCLADTYGIDNGVEYDGTALSMPDWYVMDSGSKPECPSFAVDLSDLFPFLKVNQLPLYMINEPINIELTFHPTRDKRVQIGSGDTDQQTMNIVRDELKFCADYIYYGASDEMIQYQNANRDLSFSFVDYRLVEHTTSGTEIASGVVRNLGMANRMVPRIITVLPDSGQGEDTLLGGNNSQAPSLSADGVSSATTGLRYNVRYNDRFEFTSDVDNSARLFSSFTQSEGVPFITRQEFSDQGGVAGDITDDTLQGQAQKANLTGNFFYLGTKLTNGRVGQRGLELFLTGAFDTSGTPLDLMRNYCEYIRVARLTDGLFDVFNA
jgi:hypothetical protein